MTDGPSVELCSAPFDLDASSRTPPHRAINFWGWVPFMLAGQTIELTPLPLIDDETWLAARCTYADALVVAAREGARLMTAPLVERVYADGFRLRPVILPAGPDMVRRSYALRHDQGCWRQLLEWDASTPVANFGKDWLEGPTANGTAPKGRSINFGWLGEGPYRTPAGLRCWQPVSSVHNDLHWDYAQCLRLWRPIA